MSPEPPLNFNNGRDNPVVLYRLTDASQGAFPTIVAMTEPRPRLTNTIGSVQQISVVNDDANPRAARERGRIPPPSPFEKAD
jgi:hypothetical protein